MPAMYFVVPFCCYFAFFICPFVVVVLVNKYQQKKIAWLAKMNFNLSSPTSFISKLFDYLTLQIVSNFNGLNLCLPVDFI